MPTIRADFTYVTGEVTPRLFGAGFEHLGAGVYGGAWIGDYRDGGPAVDRGWRQDVLDLIRSLKPGLLRWPGGNFAQYYHWRDGVGPQDQRPYRFDYFWAKPEPNLVGTPEFLDLCISEGIEPVIAVNTRTGTPEEAAAWVEYCNSPPHTEMGQLRTSHGHPEVYAVKLWAVGSQGWDLGAEDAARRHAAFTAAMQAVDPKIEVIGVGGNASNLLGWNRTMLENAKGHLGSLGVWAYDGVSASGTDHPIDIHYANVASAERLLALVGDAARLTDELAAERQDIGVFFDSWGLWRVSRQGLQHDYHLSDGLAAAVVLNGLMRVGRRVKGAIWGNLVNALGLIQATERSAWTTPVYEVFRMFRRHHGGDVVWTSVDSPGMDVPGGSAPIRPPRPPQNNLPLVDVAASRDKERGRYVMSVVNRHYDERIDCDLSFTGLPSDLGATAYTLTADDVFATNSAANKRNVEPYEVPVGPLGATYSFPSRSVTFFVWEETPGLLTG